METLEANNCVQKEVLLLHWKTWNNLSLCKQISTGSFRNNDSNKIYAYKSY